MTPRAARRLRLLGPAVRRRRGRRAARRPAPSRDGVAGAAGVRERAAARSPRGRAARRSPQAPRPPAGRPAPPRAALGGTSARSCYLTPLTCDRLGAAALAGGARARATSSARSAASRSTSPRSPPPRARRVVRARARGAPPPGGADILVGRGARAVSGARAALTRGIGRSARPGGGGRRPRGSSSRVAPPRLRYARRCPSRSRRSRARDRAAVSRACARACAPRRGAFLGLAQPPDEAPRDRRAPRAPRDDGAQVARARAASDMEERCSAAGARRMSPRHVARLLRARAPHEARRVEAVAALLRVTLTPGGASAMRSRRDRARVVRHRAPPMGARRAVFRFPGERLSSFSARIAATDAQRGARLALVRPVAVPVELSAEVHERHQAQRGGRARAARDSRRGAPRGGAPSARGSCARARRSATRRCARRRPARPRSARGDAVGDPQGVRRRARRSAPRARG